jgi:membrane-associated phospholipid phosphatase
MCYYVDMNFNWQSLLKRRLDRKAFTGLPLTIFVIVFLILLATFIGITSSILESSPIVKLDSSLAQFLYSQRVPWLAKVFYFITNIADQLTIIILLVISLIYLFFKKELAYLYSILVAVLGTEISVYTIKIIINRPRPILDITYYVEKSQSFPSGHSAMATAFFGFIAYYFICHIKEKNKKTIVLLLCILLVLLIGFSRLYLIVHFLSDVLGGFLIGGLWLVAGITFREHNFYTNSLKKGKNHSSE